MQKNHLLLLKILKNTESAQLWNQVGIVNERKEEKPRLGE